MTRKNAVKKAARGRQDKFAGKYMHHRRVVAGEPTDPSGPANRKLSMETALALAREKAPAAVAKAGARFGDTPYLYVVGDASEPLGATIAAASRANATGVTPGAALAAVASEVASEVGRRHARNGNLPFGGLLTVADLGNILGRTSTPEQIQIVVEIMARFSTPAPQGYVHVFAVAAGEVLASLAPVVKLCPCGHPVTGHDAKGACTFFGVPQGPMLGLPEPLAAQARALGIPMKCPCTGVAYYDAAGRRQAAYEEAAVGRLLHDESEADEDGFITGAGFDRYGGFPGDGLS